MKILPKEERCQEMVCGSGSWGAFHQHQCGKKAVVTQEGKRYCKIHDPEYVAKKSQERNKKYDEELKIRRIERAGPMLLQACKNALEASHDPMAKKILSDVIKRVEGRN